MGMARRSASDKYTDRRAPGRLHGLRIAQCGPRVICEAIAVVVIVVTGLIGWSDRIAPASAQCGPDQASAVWTALAVLPNERVTGRRFASAPRKQLRPVCRSVHSVSDHRGSNRKLADSSAHVSPG